MAIKMELTVVAVHGEGDRDTVNALQNHRNSLEAIRLRQPPPDPADEPPEVLVVLRDDHHDTRIEWPIRDWQEVERWKQLIGFDQQKRHWQHGAKVLVKVG